MPETIIPAGAALEYLRKKFGGVFAELETRPATSTSAASVVGNNPDRLGLLVLNLGGTNVSLGLTQSVAAATGILLAANGGSMSLDIDSDFTLTTREWYAIAAAGTPSLYILEIVRPVSNAQLGGTTP